MSTATVQRPSRPMPPAHVALPALRLLDHSSLADALQPLLGADARVENVRVTYLDYAPGTALVLQFSADVDGQRQHGVVRAGHAVCDDARTTGDPLHSLDAVVHWLPSDPRLPLLAASVEQLHALTAHVTIPAQRTVAPDQSPKTLAYVPGQRATLALAPYVYKAYASVAAFDSASVAMSVLGDGHALPTPRRVTSLPAHLTTVQHLMSGTAAAPSQAIEMAAAAGLLLRRLHASTRTAPVTRDTAAQLRDARTSVEMLGAVLPDQRQRATALLRRLTEHAPTGLPLVLSHGDFTIDQFLVAPDGELVVTDVDNACQAPAAHDLASFAANLVSGRPGDEQHAEAVLAALVASYGAPPGLRWHLAVALLRRCDRPFRRMKKRWPEKSLAILEMAEKVSTSCA